MASSKEVLFNPILDNNPIALQVLGICSALAVTVSMANTLVMCAAVTAVTAFSSLFISMLRNHMPSSIPWCVQAFCFQWINLWLVKNTRRTWR